MILSVVKQRSGLAFREAFLLSRTIQGLFWTLIDRMVSPEGVEIRGSILPGSVPNESAVALEEHPRRGMAHHPGTPRWILTGLKH
jgi:hypothetical protein